MAVSNKDRVSRALDLAREGLTPFVERELRGRLGDDWLEQLEQRRNHPLKRDLEGKVAWDSYALLKTMIDNWQGVFRNALGNVERAWVGELLDVRNKFAHEEPFNSDDALRALDTAQRLLMAVSARKGAEALEQAKQELMRTVYTEQARSQTRQKTLTLEGAPKSGLKPWREIVTPHVDVASGKFPQAEFAADLAQVHRGEGSAEYLDPVEFYRRTYLTEGLTRLVKSTIQRLSGAGGDPVIELQTNFGGGKTHSMLALYHLVGAEDPKALPGVENIMSDLKVEALPKCRVAVMVGTALSPAETHEKPDGTVTRTLWGEMAWQLGGKEGYALVADSDEKGVSPGSDLLSRFMRKYAPCLILIDEWVAYFRQTYGLSEFLPAGSFEANLTFAQALSEAAAATDGAIVVASLPASQIEIGGEGGQIALDRLTNTFGRIETPWLPASADESFEIVRRRLFEPIVEKDDFAARDAVIKAFGDMYRSASGEFPQVCGEGEYRRRMEKAYPIHPELFERLYNDWSALEKFQRTRGVLRLMATVIHALWERNDASLMILPASVPLDNLPVEAEMVKYLSEGWAAVIAHDIDGETSVPLAIDKNTPNLGRYSAARRVARTIYMGSAPTSSQGKNPGIDDRRIRLGCVQPGESPATFGDALRRLADRATYLYQDAARYWFSTQPSISRMADDRAAQYDAEDVKAKLVEILRRDKERGDFTAVHIAPDEAGDVADETETRLVILGPDYPHSRNGDSRGKKAAEEILKTRGNAQRLYRNTVIFLAADEQRLKELYDAVRKLMAWTSIYDEREGLDLTATTTRQAETRKVEFHGTVEARIKETWRWALAPYQPDPQDRKIEWLVSPVTGQDALAVRTSKKLVNEEALMTRFGAMRLRLAVDEKHLWDDVDHINTKKLWEYFASYLYLPRLRDSGVLRGAIEAGIADLANENFGYAERYDEEKSRYDGLKMTGGGMVAIDSMSVLVKPDVAKAQLERDQQSKTKGAERDTRTTEGDAPAEGGAEPAVDKKPKRFFATVEVSADRAARDMGKIAEEVLQHLTTLPGSSVKVIVEIDATVTEGVEEDVQRTVTENCQTLKFTSHGFETE